MLLKRFSSPFLSFPSSPSNFESSFASVFFFFFSPQESWWCLHYLRCYWEEGFSLFELFEIFWSEMVNWNFQTRRNKMKSSLLFWILKLFELSLLSLLLLLLLLLLSFTLATMLAATLPAARTKLRKVKALRMRKSWIEEIIMKISYIFLIGLAGLQFSVSEGS